MLNTRYDYVRCNRDRVWDNRVPSCVVDKKINQLSGNSKSQTFKSSSSSSSSDEEEADARLKELMNDSDGRIKGEKPKEVRNRKIHQISESEPEEAIQLINEPKKAKEVGKPKLKNDITLWFPVEIEVPLF